MKTKTEISLSNNYNKVLDLFYRYGLYMVFILLFSLFSIINSNFMTFKNITNLMLQTSSSVIAASGLIFVMITGGIDISIGAIMLVTAVSSTVLTENGLGITTTIIASIFIGGIIGAVNGFCIAKLKVVPLIVTLSMLYIIRGLAIGIIGVKTMGFTNDAAKALVRTRLFGFLPLIIAIMIIVIAISQFILSKTIFGKQMYAIGNNKLGALKMGISVDKNILIAYILCGASSGLAGLISGAQVGYVTPNFAVGQEFIIISAVVLGGVSLFGGKGKIFPGAFLGILIIMCIENGLVMAKANMYAYTIIRGLVIFFAVMMDSAQNKGETR